MMMLLGLVACTEHGEAPTSCDPDFVLVGRPGAVAEVPVLLGRDEIFESCIVLDASKNAEAVTFTASSEGGESFELVLRSVDGTFLVSDQHQGLLAYVLPPGPTMHVTLSVVPEAGLVSARFPLTLEFFEAQ